MKATSTENIRDTHRVIERVELVDDWRDERSGARPEADGRLVRCEQLTASSCNALICDAETWCAALYSYVPPVASASAAAFGSPSRSGYCAREARYSEKASNNGK